ncbi:MAG TPA: hypothetical protein VF657_15010 [Actinoplanes sp.]
MDVAAVDVVADLAAADVAADVAAVDVAAVEVAADLAAVDVAADLAAVDVTVVVAAAVERAAVERAAGPTRPAGASAEHARVAPSLVNALGNAVTERGSSVDTDRRLDRHDRGYSAKPRGPSDPIPVFTKYRRPACLDPAECR